MDDKTQDAVEPTLEARVAAMEEQLATLNKFIGVQEQRHREQSAVLLQSLGSMLYNQGGTIADTVRYPTEVLMVPSESEENDGTLYISYDAEHDYPLLKKEENGRLVNINVPGVDYAYLKQWMQDKDLLETTVKVNISVTR